MKPHRWIARKIGNATFIVHCKKIGNAGLRIAAQPCSRACS
jgi:hypothetical protein